jgi:hypothetical protein
MLLFLVKSLTALSLFTKFRIVCLLGIFHHEIYVEISADTF